MNVLCTAKADLAYHNDGGQNNISPFTLRERHSTALEFVKLQ